MAEAKRRVGEKGYSITKKNCQHFVGEVRNGTSCSPEVQGVINGMFYTAVAGTVALAGTALFSYLLNKKNSDKNQVEDKKEKVQPI